MNAPFLRPHGCPPDVEPFEWRGALLERIERQAALLSALIDALDIMDADCDLEHNGDAEPWLGWTAGGALANRYDLELDAQEERGPRLIDLHGGAQEQSQ